MIASTSSVCPFPCTPATATISPAWTTRSRSRTDVWPRSSVTVRPEISSTGAPGIAGSLATSRATVRPTIISASDSCVASAGVVDPTTRPRRSTVIRSEISRTSLSLWVMKMIEVPPACSERMISNSSSVSWGVSTADGSSRIRRLDWR